MVCDVHLDSYLTDTVTQETTDIISGLPLAPSLEDNDFDVNDFPVSNQALRLHSDNPNFFQIDPIELFRNDDGATNMYHADEGWLVDHQWMQVDQPTLEDVSHPFKGEIHQTTAVKKELRDNWSFLNLWPVKWQHLEFDGILLPSPAEVYQWWDSEEVKPAQANPSLKIEEMNKNVESWCNVHSPFQMHQA